MFGPCFEAEARRHSPSGANGLRVGRWLNRGVRFWPGGDRIHGRADLGPRYLWPRGLRTSARSDGFGIGGYHRRTSDPAAQTTTNNSSQMNFLATAVSGRLRSNRSWSMTMAPEELATNLRRKPFVPFRITLTEGST